MKSTLIKDTTKSERIELVKQWEESEGCESSGIDLMEFFRDYIDGVKEISEVNAAFTARYISEIPDDNPLYPFRVPRQIHHNYPCILLLPLQYSS